MEVIICVHFWTYGMIYNVTVQFLKFRHPCLYQSKTEVGFKDGSDLFKLIRYSTRW